MKHNTPTYDLYNLIADLVQELIDLGANHLDVLFMLNRYGITDAQVDGHDPRAWSDTISRLLLEPEKRLILSMGAVEHASHFGWDSTARGILDVYDQVLSRGIKKSRALA